MLTFLVVILCSSAVICAPRNGSEHSQLDSLDASFALLPGSEEIECDAYYTEMTGSFNSPRYPGQYPNKADCHHYITVAAGYTINLIVKDFQTESCCDYLKVYDGNTIDESALLELRGSVPGDSAARSTGSKMLIYFHSDESVTESGFEAFYVALSTGCGGSFTDMTGSFISPNYPSNYPLTVDCYYYITVATGYIIELIIRDFRTESCCDYLKVYDGTTINQELLVDLRGHVTAGTVGMSTTNKMMIHFHSDGTVTDYGFDAQYITLSQSCGGYHTEMAGSFNSPNYPDTYPTNSNCYFYITVTPGFVIRIIFKNFQTDSGFAFVKVYNGISKNEESLIELEGSILDDRTAISTTNKMLVYFHSDGGISDSGFTAHYMAQSSECGGYYTDVSGTLTSPNYPYNYPDNVDCYYYITVSTQYIIQLTVDDFCTESCCDFLTVYDGDNINLDVLLDIRGSISGDGITRSTGNKMLLYFHTDGSTSYYGYRAYYSAINPVFSGQYSDLTGVLHSPNFPNDYPNRADSFYYITVDSGYVVNLQVTDFEAEVCCDYLKVYDGHTNGQPLLLDLRGSHSNVATVSTQNVMLVYFHSDSSITDSGFQAYYYSISTSCGGYFADMTGTFTSPSYPYNWNYYADCNYYITVPTGYFVQLILKDYQLQSCCDSIVVYDWLLNSRYTLFESQQSGSNKILTSTENKLIVHFSTSYSGAYSGFEAYYFAFSPNCGGYFTNMTESFTSPNHPDDYPNNADCYYLISAPPDHIPQLIVEDFKTESCCDSLEVYDGYSVNQQTLLQLRGTVPEESIVRSTGELMLVHFQSDVGVTDSGFRAHYIALTSDCGGHYSDLRGSFTSSNYPDEYPNNVDCYYYITVPINYAINIILKEIHFGAAGYDYLTVFDGDTEDHPMIRQLFGDYTNYRLRSTGNKMLLHFHTDSSGTNIGFDASYTADISEVRLIGSEFEKGRLEIYHNGIWGTVCDDDFDAQDAQVACMALGFSSYGPPYTAGDGRDSDTIWLDDVACDGNELSLTDCMHPEWGQHNCNHGEDVGVDCRGVRLVGSDVDRGRLEIYHDGQWGTICDNDFGRNEAKVVCLALGLRSYGLPFTAGDGSGPIWLDDLQCIGNEFTLFDCAHLPWGTFNCDHGEDVGVDCREEVIEVRIAGGSSFGRLEVYYNGIWGTVCDDSFDIYDANVACRMMGYSSAYNFYTAGGGSGEIWLDDLECNGYETSLVECLHPDWGSHNCAHSEDVGVECS
ncbi:cubilin-like [Mytilus californianus]|uniref:cubilin-like n=1 Tax=Mytilus californianus TaxID=6549 RepID=UPI0022481848|nr:cubilin-like [Mytilus californianus]XP_052085417.1 cubilin-like [Mytilus californianus]